MYNSLEQLQNVVPNNVKMNLHGKKRKPLLSNSLGPARRSARDLPRLRRVHTAHLKLSKELAHESSPPSVYPAVVSGIASQERFPIEEEGVFMRRLSYCCAGLALSIGAFPRRSPAHSPHSAPAPPPSPPPPPPPPPP